MVELAPAPTGGPLAGSAPQAVSTSRRADLRAALARRRGGPTLVLVAQATGWYLVNRLVIGAALGAAALHNPSPYRLRYLAQLGDGLWYLGVARVGYFPTSAPPGTLTSIGFFPLLPALIRAADVVVPGGPAAAAVVVCFLAGWGALVATTLLARELYDDATAGRAAALVASLPGAFVFSLIYTEGLLLAASALALVLLRRRRYGWAGLAGALAAVSRPSGLAFVAAAGLVAVVAVHRRREWKALATPALSVVGIGAYFAYLWHRTGRPLAWFENQRDFWGQRNDLGGFLIDWLRALATWGWDRPDEVLAGLLLVALVPVLVFYARHRPPDLAVNAYVAVSLAITLSSVLGPRPRFLLAAFPLAFPFAERWTGRRHATLVVVGFAVAVGFTLYYAIGVPAATARFDFAGVPAV